MKIKIKSILLLISFLWINTSIAQNFVLGGTVNYAYSKIIFHDSNQNFYDIKFAPSFNIGIFLEANFTENSLWGIEALWVQIEGIEESEVGLAAGPNTIYYTQGTQTFLSYLGLPLYFKYKYGKLGIKFGLQTMIKMKGSSYSYTYNDTFFDSSYREKIDLKKIDAGYKMGIDFKLLKKLSLRVDYYHGQVNIMTHDLFNPRKNRQLSAGVTYIFGFNF